MYRTLIEKKNEYHLDINFTFIDYVKDFDITVESMSAIDILSTAFKIKITVHIALQQTPNLRCGIKNLNLFSNFDKLSFEF